MREFHFVLWLLLLFPSWALACTCRGYSSPEEAVTELLARASSVVVAEAISVQNAKVPVKEKLPYSRTSLEGQITVFNVRESWKGNHSKEFRTRIPTECCVCGMDFSEGDVYLLFLFGPDEEGFYSTGSCSWPKRIEEAKVEIEVLDKLLANKELSPEAIEIGT